MWYLATLATIISLAVMSGCTTTHFAQATVVYKEHSSAQYREVKFETAMYGPVVSIPIPRGMVPSGPRKEFILYSKIDNQKGLVKVFVDETTYDHTQVGDRVLIKIDELLGEKYVFFVKKM